MEEQERERRRQVVEKFQKAPFEEIAAHCGARVSEHTGPSPQGQRVQGRTELLDLGTSVTQKLDASSTLALHCFPMNLKTRLLAIPASRPRTFHVRKKS